MNSLFTKTKFSQISLRINNLVQYTRYHSLADPHFLPKKSQSSLREIVIVRAGESEGSLAYRKSELGDLSLYAGEFQMRHSWMWRLTDRGRQQVDAAAEWLQENVDTHFDRMYCSEFVRAMETSARLKIPNARWISEILLRDRDWGQMEGLSFAERTARFNDELKRMERDHYLFSPPGGESLAEMSVRVDRILSAMHSSLPEKRVLVVTHTDVMWAVRQQVERLSLPRFRDLRHSSRPQDQFHGGQILIYTRVNPESGKLAPAFQWMKSICPWNPELSKSGWQRIQSSVYDNQMLRAACEQFPRIIRGPLLKTSPKEPSQKLSYQASSLSELDDDADPSEPDYLPLRGEPLQLKKALIVQKTTRYEVERDKYQLDGDKLEVILARQGVNFNKLKSSHEAHRRSLEFIFGGLQDAGVEVQFVRSDAFSPAQLKGYDVVFAAGGDGTFLQTSTHIGGCMTPVVGVNTDTVGSQGHLCCCFAQSKAQFREIIDRLQAGEFNWKKLRRIQIQLVTSDGQEVLLPYLALNEVFLSEAEPCRPSIFDIGIDRLERQTVRSSGVIVCSGTGSTAWFTSASRVHNSTVQSVLKAAGVTSHLDQVNSIVNDINGRLPFHFTSNKLGYIVREPIINRAHNIGVKHRLGRAERISIRSLGWEAKLVMDGLTSIPLNFGVQAVLTACSDKDQLHTIDFNMDDHNPTKDLNFSR